mgnify:FL=1
MGVKFLKHRSVFNESFLKISNVSTLLLGVGLFFSSFIGAQERMTEYNKNFTLYDFNGGIKKLSSYYLQKYQQNKDKQDLAYARYSEIYIHKKDTLGNLKRAYEIIRYSNETSELRSRAYFWAAVFLENSALDLSLNYLKKSAQLNEAYNYELEKILTYHVIGRVYYKKRDYQMALHYYEKALRVAQQKKDLLNMSSMYNNMSLVYDKEKNSPKAVAYAQKSIRLLYKPEDFFFLNVVKTNIGDYYFKMKKYPEAETYYNSAFQYYCKIPESKSELSSTIPNLYSIYENNPSKREPFIEKVKALLDADKTNPINITILKVMLANAFKEGDLKEAEKVSDLLNSYTLEYKRFLNKRHAETSNLLAQYISGEFTNEQKIQQQKDTIRYMAIAAVLILLSGGTYYLFRIKNLEKKEAIIQKEFLEKENSWIQERFNYIKLNLELKTKTEKELLKRLKSLRKSQNDDAQEVVKELYLNISNLLQIDKRQESDLLIENPADDLFLEKLKNLSPDLTPLELKLCGYLRLPLTSKEVATFIDSTPGAVRVAKTKIKQKFSLPKEQKLDDFLKNL